MFTRSKLDKATIKRRGPLVKSSFVVAVTAALVVAFSPAASGGSSTPLGALGASVCGGGVWPETAIGAPAALASAGSSAVYVWVSSGAWHLRVKGARSLPVTGQLSGNARLRASNVTAGVRSSVDPTGKRLTFSVTGARAIEGVDLQASCATLLRFAFSASNPGAGAQPRVYLGARGQAPAATFALARPATTGVAGRILVGPTCPVVTTDCPPAKAIQGMVRIEQAPTARGGGGGGLVARVPSDAAGNFNARLAPGHYMLVVEQAADSYPRAKPSLVDVQNGVVTDVTLVLDTGIR
jgi:hypothetical protein